MANVDTICGEAEKAPTPAHISRALDYANELMFTARPFKAGKAAVQIKNLIAELAKISPEAGTCYDVCNELLCRFKKDAVLLLLYQGARDAANECLRTLWPDPSSPSSPPETTMGA